mgnify:CR=1 FL=1|jgi:DNA-binding MarR family transcriptional regulator
MSQDHITGAIMNFSRQLRQESDRILQENDINTLQARILCFVSRNEKEPLCQRDFQEKFFARGSTISGIVDTMEKEGLLSRIPEERDKRKNRVVLTEKGKTAANRCHAIFEDIDRQVTSTLDGKEAERFISIMGKLQTSLEHMHE